MPVCYQCDQYFEGFVYGYGYNKQCGVCHDKEEASYRRKYLDKLEKEKLELEIIALKKKIDVS